MARALEQRANFGVVEDFAFVGNPLLAILVGHRLVAGGEVDDAQPAVPQCGIGIDVITEIVRSAVAKRPSHFFENRSGLPIGAGPRESGYATHIFLSLAGIPNALVYVHHGLEIGV